MMRHTLVVWPLAAALAACGDAPAPAVADARQSDAATELRGGCILAMRQRWPGGDAAAVYPTAAWPVLESGDGSAVVLVPLKGGGSLHCRVRRVAGGILVETLI